MSNSNSNLPISESQSLLTPTSYLDYLASYEGFSEKLLTTYERDPKIFWNSEGFLSFLAYQGARDIGYFSLERLLSCAVRWKEQEHKTSNDIRYCPLGCGDTCFCGRCCPAKTKQRAAHAFNIFSELIKAVRALGIKLESKGLEIELTIPIWLSDLFADSSNRPYLRQWVDRFFKVGIRAIKKWFRKMGIKGDISGSVAFHWWKSGAPWKPHLHLHFLLAPVYLAGDGVLHPLPRWYEEKDLDLLRGVWKQQLEKEFGDGIEETLNVHVNYLKRLKRTNKERRGKVRGHSVQFRLEYIYRSPVGDFAKALKKYCGEGLFEVLMIPEGTSRKERELSVLPYSDLRPFIDFIDAFSAPRLRHKTFGFHEEAKERSLFKKTVFDELDEQKVRRYRDNLKENNSELYNTVVSRTSRSSRVGKGKGGLERIRWFGFLSKRKLGKFLESLNIQRSEVESQWKDTGQEFRFLCNTGNGIGLEDIDTGEIVYIPRVLMSSLSGIGGSKWVWRFVNDTS